MKSEDERKQLMGLVSRTLPTVPSILTDRILESKWLQEHDERIRNEVLEDLAAREAGAQIIR